MTKFLALSWLKGFNRAPSTIRKKASSSPAVRSSPQVSMPAAALRVAEVAPSRIRVAIDRKTATQQQLREEPTEHPRTSTQRSP